MTFFSKNSGIKMEDNLTILAATRFDSKISIKIVSHEPYTIFTSSAISFFFKQQF